MAATAKKSSASKTSANNVKTASANKTAKGGKASSNRDLGKKGSSKNTAAKKVQTKKKTSVYVEERNPYENEIIVVIALVVSLLFALSTFDLCGVFGQFVGNILFGIFGILAYLIPYLLFLVVIFSVSNKRNYMIQVKIGCCVGIYVVATAFIHMCTSPIGEVDNIFDFYLQSAIEKSGGGMLGGFIGTILSNLFGFAGAYVVLFGFLIALLIIITEKMLFAEMFEQGKCSRKKMLERRIERQAERELQREAYREQLLQQQAQQIERRKARTFTFSKEENATMQNIDKVAVPTENPIKRMPVQTEKNKKEMVLKELPLEDTSSYIESSFGVSGRKTKFKVFETDIENEKMEIKDASCYKEEPKAKRDIKQEVKTNLVSSGNMGLNQSIVNGERKHIGNLAISRGVEKALSEITITREPAYEPIKKQEVSYPSILDYKKEKETAIPVYEEELKQKFKHNKANSKKNIVEQKNLEKEQQKEMQEDWEVAPFEVKFCEENDLEAKVEIHSNKEDVEIEKDKKRDEIITIQENAIINQEPNESEIRTENETSMEEEIINKNEEVEKKPNKKNGKNKQTIESGKREKSVTTEKKKTTESTRPVLKNEEVGKLNEVIKESITIEKPEYQFPSIDLLDLPKGNEYIISDEELKDTAMKLQSTLESFGVRVEMKNVSCGPTVTRYEVQPAQGVKVSKITALTDDIKLSLAAADIRIEAPIPGKSAVGIEVPNTHNSIVMFRTLIENKEFIEHNSNIAIAVGKDIAGKTILTDIAKMPHLLIAGATGSGKSVFINTLIMSILYKAHPDDVKLIMVDPKVVELSVYNGIPHLLIPVVTEPKKASAALNWAVMEMDERYNKFVEFGVRDLKSYNRKVAKLQNEEGLKVAKIPQIVIIVDELADLMMVAAGEVENAICRLAQKARAAGIHLVLATQRPSVNVITGVIKANVPSRVAFSVSSGIDSRTILDGVGAEKLLGNGDMLFFPSGYSKPIRVQGSYISDDEVNAVVEFLREQNGAVEYNDEIEKKISTATTSDSGQVIGNDRDDRFVEVAKFIIEKEKASIGSIQRAFKVGYNRAARIMEQLYDAGIVGAEEGTKARQVIMSMEEFEQYMDDYL